MSVAESGQNLPQSATSSVATCDRVLRPGNTNCAGCGMSIGLQWLDEALAQDKPYMVIPACCGIVTAGAFPTTAYGVPIVRRPELARTIYASVKPGKPIPEKLYVAVAEVLAMIYRLRHKK